MLQPFVPHTGNRAAVLYYLWPVGPGPIWLYSCLPKIYSKGKPIKVFNNGQMQRDFTYIDDIVEGVVRAMHPPTADSNWTNAKLLRRQLQCAV